VIRYLRGLAFFALSFLSMTGLAHEARPGYLQLKQITPQTIELLSKVPARGGKRLSLDPQLPTHCQPVTPPTAHLVDGAYTERVTLRCAERLTGETIRIEGLSSTQTDMLVRFERLDGSVQVTRLTPAAPSFVVAASPNAREVATTYLLIGIEHILLGVDHLLFVLALLFVVQGWRRLVATITAFTLAHSLTLAAATFGWVSFPQQPVEAVIALSIVLVAGEIVRADQGRPSMTRRWPWLVAFVFGLLHGLGFAGALSEVGLPEQSIPLALLLFNVGVEVGQLLFIGAVALATKLLIVLRTEWPSWVKPLPAYGIGTIAVYWVIERALGFWS